MLLLYNFFSAILLKSFDLDDMTSMAIFKVVKFAFVVKIDLYSSKIGEIAFTIRGWYSPNLSKLPDLTKRCLGGFSRLPLSNSLL